MDILRALIGTLVLTGVAFLFSCNRKAIRWKQIGIGVFLQIVFGVLILKVSFVYSGLESVGGGFVKLTEYATEGAKFVFGGLAANSFEDPKAGHSMGFILAFQVLPIILFFSVLSTLLYYLGVLQYIVKAFAWVFTRLMGVSGPESLSAAANVFIGQAEAPLVIKPYLSTLTKSEMNCLMTIGMCTIAGSVMGAYVKIVGGPDPAQQTLVATQLLCASLMNVPGGIAMAKILFPPGEEKVNSSLEVPDDRKSFGVNPLDAIARGAGDGIKLAVNVGGMLIVFVALIFLVNGILGKIGHWTHLNEVISAATEGNYDSLSLQYILGQVCRPLAFAMGVEWKDTLQMGALLGTKTVLNEFFAYLDLSGMKEAGTLSGKTVFMATFALCGFSNFSSIAIQIGGIGVLAPSQKTNLSQLGMRALLGGGLACLLTGTIAGALY